MSIAHETHMVAVNAAFLREIKETNDALWALLKRIRRCLKNTNDLRSSFSDCIELICEFRDALALHFALEEAYGYFEDAAAVEPQLSRRAFDLRAEHSSLYESIVQLVDRGEWIRRHGLQFTELAAFVNEFFDFERVLRRHERLENELILEETDQDIGNGD